MNCSRSFSWIITGIICSSMMLGCGGSRGPERASISGNVTVDGAPLEEGVVTFIPDKGTEGPTSGAKIRNGQYHILATEGPVLGSHRVEVTARKTESGKPAPPAPQPGEPVPESGPPGETLIQYIPDQYNAKSTLSFEIKAGVNQFDIPIELEKSGKPTK